MVAIEILQPITPRRPEAVWRGLADEWNGRGVVVAVLPETLVRKMIHQLSLPGLAAPRPSRLRSRTLLAVAAGVVLAIGLGFAAWIGEPARSEGRPAIRVVFAGTPAVPAMAATPATRVVQPEQRSRPAERRVLPGLPMRHQARRSTGVPEFQAFDESPQVSAAIKAAMGSGTAQPWTDGDLFGYVVAGPAEIEANQTCRTAAVWVQARGAVSGKTISSRRCLLKNGRWAKQADPVADPMAGAERQSQLPFAGAVMQSQEPGAN